MAAASLLGPSYVNPSAAHTPSCRLHHWRPPKASLSFPHLPPAALALHLGGRGRLRQRQQLETRRGDCLLARAGPPSTATLVFAFVFPLSLIIGTIFASVRIADQLDEKFLQEVSRMVAQKYVILCRRLVRQIGSMAPKWWCFSA